MDGVVEVAPGVLVTTSSLYVTTSTIVTHAGCALLVDPGWVPSELRRLAAVLAGHSLTVAAGWSTHAHHDHLLWHPSFGAAPRWATPTAAGLATEHRDELVEQLGPGWPDELVELMGRVQPLESPEIPWPDPRAPEALIAEHDGHSPGHGAVWLPGPRVLLAGDMLSDVELPLPQDPPDSDRYGGDVDSRLGAYLDGLDRLAPYVRRAAVLVPGHGHVTDRPIDRLDADRRYLDDLLSGRAVDDPRLALPDMTEAHRSNLALAGR